MIYRLLLITDICILPNTMFIEFPKQMLLKGIQEIENIEFEQKRNDQLSLER